MKVEPLPIAGAFCITPEPRGDARGFFARSFCAQDFAARGLASVWAQVNLSHSSRAGTLRGLHFQRPPAAEVKLIRCTAGAVWDVLLDLRRDSPTFGQWAGVALSAENLCMAYVPKGVAHGFQTLTDGAELLYFHDTPYTPGAEGGVNPLDPALDIPWPLPVAEMSDRDRALPPLSATEPMTP